MPRKRRSRNPRIYETAEWKAKARAYVEGKPCEWCGRHAGDVVEVEDRKGNLKRITLKIAPHHRKKIEMGLMVNKRLANQFYREHFKGGANRDEYDALRAQAVSELPERVEEKDIKARLRFIFDKNHRDELDAQYEEYKKWAEEEYMDLRPEKTVILCNRCHWAREKGMVLCLECNHYYRDPRYPTCYKCLQKTRAAQEAEAEIKMAEAEGEAQARAEWKAEVEAERDEEARFEYEERQASAGSPDAPDAGGGYGYEM